MNLNRKTYTTELDGETISLEFSNIAHQANAAVLGKHGETIVLATVVIGKEEQEGINYFPLTVDYEERFYAVGKILGSRFVRREGRPSDEATLSARLVDRTIRPLFDSRLRRAVQVTITVLAYDGKHDPDTIAVLATSTALSVSDIPWDGPIAGVQAENNSAFFAGPENKINMIEFEGSEESEEHLVSIFEQAQSKINNLIAFQKKIVDEMGKPKLEIVFSEADKQTKQLVRDITDKAIEDALKNKKVNELKSELTAALEEKSVSDEAVTAARVLLETRVEKFLKDKIIKEKKRVDGRALDEVRPLYSETGLFSQTHGSALFVRGSTQILSVTTLASPSAKQLVETMRTSESKRFLLHYNFPSFSVGEVGRARGPGRRDIGHGALAKKALNAIIPPKEEFPYTIRVVAETLSSNGSSSMATVCATSLSLMDAGVKIKKHVAGIAMGLAYDEDTDSYEILTDIQGPEDSYGDMDLKVAGTKDGINAAQMDVKILGITKEIFAEALSQAKKARLEILGHMRKTFPSHRPQVSPHAPTILVHIVKPEKIGEVIGPGGRVINGIIAAAGEDISIDIEEDGTVYISGLDPKQAQKALELVKEVVKEYKVGEFVQGTVSRIMEFGAIVELGGRQSGMIHISELGDEYVKSVTDVLHEGDTVKAKIIKVENGKIGLSLKAVK